MRTIWHGWMAVWLMVMLAAGAALPAAAKESRPLLAGLAAWQDGHGIRLQGETDREYDRLEVAVSNGVREERVTFSREERVSLSIQGSEAALVQVRAYQGGALVKHALYRLKGEAPTGNARFGVRRTAWEQHPDDVRLLLVEVVGEAETSTADDISRQEAEMRTALYGTADADELSRVVSKKGKKMPLSGSGGSYEVEPNDSRGKADWAFAGKDAFGKIQAKGDVDFWKVKAPKNGTFAVWLSEIPDGRNYDIAVYDQDGRQIAASRRSGEADELVEGVGVEKNSWLYIAVSGVGDSFDKRRYYRLRPSFQAEGVSEAPDAFEANNSFDQAAELPVGSEQEATIHQETDVDFYLIRVPLASTIELRLRGAPKEMDLDLFLFDKAHRQAAASERGPGQDEAVTYNADPGVYYVKVARDKRSALSAGRYRLLADIRTIPVMLIPGIGGSRLMAEERGKVSEAWLNIKGMILNPTDSQHRRYLTLTPARPGSREVAPLTSGVTVTPEAADGGFRAVEYLSYDDRAKEAAEEFASLVNHLQRLGYRKGETLFAFPYDWRYSNADHAADLKRAIDEALARSRAAQIQLVAHSMGGLLAKETLLQFPSYQQKTRRLIYLGTPFLGSPRAYQALQLGYNFGIDTKLWNVIPYSPMSEETGKLIAKYAPSVYELLPDKRYVSRQSYLNEMADAKRPLTYEEIVGNPDLRPPYQPLTEAAEAMHERWDEKRLRVPQYLIVGDGQPTLMGYDVNPSIRLFAPFFANQGDGTVPLVSAEFGKTAMKKTYYVQEEHSRLPRNPYVIQQVAHLLSGMEAVQAGMRASPLRRSAYDYLLLYRPDGRFPDATITWGSTKLRTSGITRVPSGLRIEFHGNVVVIHRLVNSRPLRIQAYGGAGELSRNVVSLVVEHHTPQWDQRENRSGRRYVTRGEEAVIIE